MTPNPRRRTPASAVPLGWRIFIYRVPTEPASKRVTLWRDLKKLGALYLQQCACIVPNRPEVIQELERIAARVPALGGEVFLLGVPRLQPDDEARIIEGFRVQRASEYAEIVEECETKFVKEIEFEHFRQNYTFEEVEEIEQELEKIRRWYDRVRDRDWFGADRRADVDAWLERCQTLLAGFEEEVYRRRGADEGAAPEPAAPAAEAPVLRPIVPLRSPRRKPRRTSAATRRDQGA